MTCKTLHTTTEVIEALGGSRAVGEITGRTLAAASNWHRFETFPANTFVAITAALEKRGYHAPPSLWGMVKAGASSEAGAAA